MARAQRRGFTVVEILVAILIIFALMGLLIVGMTHVRKLGKSARDLQAVKALNMGVSHFATEVHFLPPLVKDMTPINANKPVVYSVADANDAKALRGQPVTIDMLRFSLYSIPYYLIGGLEVMAPAPNPNNVPIDGVAGPGFMMPKSNGTFERSGKKFEPFFDMGKDGKALFSADAAAGRVVLRDANEIAIRYYRWLRGDPNNNNQITTTADLNVPPIVGNPDENPELKSADYAIVAAGPNGVFGDEPTLPGWHPQFMSWSDLAGKLGKPDPGADPTAQKAIRDFAMADNIVGVGRAK